MTIIGISGKCGDRVRYCAGARSIRQGEEEAAIGVGCASQYEAYADDRGISAWPRNFLVRWQPPTVAVYLLKPRKNALKLPIMNLASERTNTTNIKLTSWHQWVLSLWDNR